MNIIEEEDLEEFNKFMILKLIQWGLVLVLFNVGRYVNLGNGRENVLEEVEDESDEFNCIM